MGNNCPVGSILPLIRMAKKSKYNLVWMDCEMTGLEVEKEVLIEIATLITDSELNVLEEGNDDVKGEGSKSGCFVESKMHVKWNHVNPDQFRQSGAHSSQIV